MMTNEDRRPDEGGTVSDDLGVLLAEEIVEGISEQRRSRTRSVLTAIFRNVSDELNRAVGERADRIAFSTDGKDPVSRS